MGILLQNNRIIADTMKAMSYDFSNEERYLESLLKSI